MNMTARRLVMAGLVTLALDADAVDFQLPMPSLATAEKHVVLVTYYHVTPPFRTGVANGVPILDVHGVALTKPISKRDWCSGAIEGSIAVLENGRRRVFHFVKAIGAPQVDCTKVLPLRGDALLHIKGTERSRFAEATGAMGDDVRGHKPVPYRTIAVDRSVIPFGSVVFIPAARGSTLHLPDGSVAYHDGFFIAEDTGGRIRGAHIDVFCGEQMGECIPAIMRSKHGRPKVTAYIVDDPTAKRRMQVEDGTGP